MSCSMEFSENKPNFSQKCSMLSQYLKEKGSFNDLNFAISPSNLQYTDVSDKLSQATTMNLFPVVGKPANVSPCNAKYGSNPNLDLSFFPHQGRYVAASSNERKPVTKEPESAQMTIFYGGQVIVFDDFPAEKAKEIMLLAGQQSQPSSASHPMKNKKADGSSITPTTSALPSFRNAAIPEHIQRPSKSILCDLPIARKASLHRFLEKRKDRINSRAPYQISSPSKPAETEGTSCVGFERNLLNNLSSQ